MASLLLASCGPEQESLYREAWSFDPRTLGPETHSLLGTTGCRAAIALGDIDGDGWTELAIAHPGFDEGVGAVHILSARTGDVLRSDRGADSEAFGHYGQDSCRIDDLDGDGIVDMAVSEPWFERSGRVVVVSGARGDVLLDVREPSPAGSLFGYARLISPGDIDGDGGPDLIVALRTHEPRADLPSALGDLHLVALSLPSGRVLYDVPVRGVSSVSDIVCTGGMDSDGNGELALGIGGGIVFCSWRDGAELRRWSAPGKLDRSCTLVPLSFDLEGEGRSRRAYLAAFCTYADSVTFRGNGYFLDAKLRVFRSFSGAAGTGAQLDGRRTLILRSESTWSGLFEWWNKSPHLRITDARSGKLLQRIEWPAGPGDNLGDVDGDGLDDFLVATWPPEPDPDEGTHLVFRLYTSADAGSGPR